MAYGPVNIPGINETAKGVPNGVAGLDENGKVPAEQLPEMNFEQAGAAAEVQQNVNAHIDDGSNPHGVTAEQVGAVPASEKGVAGGVAVLDKEGKVPAAQLPAMGGHTAQPSEPENTSLLWIDTANGNILKFYNPDTEAWEPVSAVWS